MDPLSEVLSSLKPEQYVARAFGFKNAVALRFPRHEGIKCYAMLSGEGWLTVEGVPEAVPLRAGDCFLLPLGRPFCLATALGLPAVDFLEFRAQREAAGLPWDDGPGGSYIAGGHFCLGGEHAGMLLSQLPPVVHLKSEADRAAMRWALERMGEELADPQPGGHLMTQQIAYMMLVQALRLHLMEAAAANPGWLFALADRQMRTALGCMHDRPGDPWTLESLAARVGMSRSVFAQRFRQTVGTTPMEYLTRWRMLLAGQRLRGARGPGGSGGSGEAVSVIAADLGYQSDSAFGKAFRKVMGTSPKQYSRGSQPLAAAGG